MPMVSISVSHATIAAAERIAKRMFPGFPNAVDADDVIARAAHMGMAAMREIWMDADDQANAKEGA